MVRIGKEGQKSEEREQLQAPKKQQGKNARAKLTSFATGRRPVKYNEGIHSKSERPTLNELANGSSCAVRRAERRPRNDAVRWEGHVAPEYSRSAETGNTSGRARKLEAQKTAKTPPLTAFRPRRPRVAHQSNGPGGKQKTISVQEKKKDRDREDRR